MKIKLMRFVVLATLVAACSCTSARADDGGVFRSGDEVIVQVKDLDLLRQSHKQLSALLRVIGVAEEKRFAVNLADRLSPAAIVIDVTGFGLCRGVSIEIKDGGGKTIRLQQVAPVPVVALHDDLPIRDDALAAIEPGSQLNPADSPRIALPDVAKLRKEQLAAPQRSVTAKSITYPMIADADLPNLASQNAVIVARQSFAPDDESQVSLYFSYRKGIFDAETLQFKKFRKMLVEAPLQKAWLEKQGDEVITLPLDEFAIHTTEEHEIGSRWNAPEGYNMLGDAANGLAQAGQSFDTDDEGRLYFSCLADGAGLVRFNPHANKFEQPPIDFHAACRDLIPLDGDWKRNWDGDFNHLVCMRGRVYIVYSRNYRVNTPNGRFETCSGVISAPQDNWDDAEAFRKDVRLHAACWPTAQHPLYKDVVAVGDASRKILSAIETTHGFTFGTWRLDLDKEGNTQRLAVIENIEDTVAADGTPLPPTGFVKYNGLLKQREINVGHAGRAFLNFGYGEFDISRAALSLTIPGAPQEHLVDSTGRSRSTYDGAPPGTLKIRFDITAKIKSDPTRYGELAAAMTGVAQGPSYALAAIPGEADQAIGVCEYGYYYSKLDFSRRANEGKVFRKYLPMQSNGEKTSFPLGVGLGPYNSAWLEHDNALWLYMAGYTGLTRMKYADAGPPLEAFTAESIHARLTPQAIDGTGRESVKDYLHVFPAMDGRLINIGRGRPDRGGGAYSAGLELFHPTTLGKSETAVVMNRCYGLYTPLSRLVLSTRDAVPRQEIFIASGSIRPEYVEDIADPTLRPKNQDPKIFAYECRSGGGLRDLYGFSLPVLPNGDNSTSNIVLSPCHQFLVVLQAGGNLLSYHIAGQRFVDGVQLRTSTDTPIHLLHFDRPAANLWTSPNGQIFFTTAPDGDKSKRVDFNEVTVTTTGRLAILPHLSVTWNSDSQVKDFDGIVRCFLPDLTNRDGSYDFILGGDQDHSAKPVVRVIDDFIPPRGR